MRSSTGDKPHQSAAATLAGYALPEKKVGLRAGVEPARGLFDPISPNRPAADSPPGLCLPFSWSSSFVKVGDDGDVEEEDDLKA